MYSSLTSEQTLEKLHSSLSGLEEAQIAPLRTEYGLNELPQKKRSVIFLFLSQFNDILIYILMGALGLAVVMRILEGGEASLEHSIDIIAIVAILLLNAVLGFVQEYRAEQALQSLQKLTAPQVRVRRMGGEYLLPSRELLPGDIVIVEAGDRIAADGRLVIVSHLEVNESSLTGESMPVHKETNELKGTLPLADRKNMVFAGTLVTRGSGEYVVTATGLNTEIGKIASLVSAAKTPPTPLENRMKQFSVVVGIGVLVLCILLAALQIWRGSPIIEVVLLAVSVAVSAVPEGLPAVVTASLAMGVRRMVKQNALVRKLDALETLGSITVICSDKTGTITENKMSVTETWVPKGGDEKELILGVASCNRAKLPHLGDPTEIGLLVYAKKMKVEPLAIDEEEVPFTSEEKYMKTRHGKKSYLKGAPEKIALLCALTSEHPLFEENAKLANKGLRVLACAVSENGKTPKFLGLIAMEDPPRASVKNALQLAEKAGIRTIMITGDNIDTAAAIAKRVGIKGGAADGRMIDSWSNPELREKVKTISVYARVSPEHKISICRALQENGEVVAMTGDGVNDAPALKAAHVGVSMGKDGTQVAREAASLILADDNYATIVSAISEGRTIYDNIRKFILYLVQANVAQLLLITITVVLGLPLPLLPLHILWINLMTDGLPALALGMEPAEKGIMDRPPRPLKEHLFAGDVGRLILAASTVCGLTLIVFLWALNRYDSLEEVRAITFSFSILIEILLAFYSRSSLPLWRVGFFTNKWLLGAALIPLALQIPLLYTPLHEVFEIIPITPVQWMGVLATAFAGLLLLEFSKLLNRPSSR
jgi:Ca2+-transporting ATPase